MSILLLWTALSAACATNAPPIYDDEIKDAITMIATELEARHHEIRCWEPIDGSAGWLTKYAGGTTALATLALLSSGTSMHTPAIKTSLSFLRDIKKPSTYVLATRTSVWSMVPGRYKRNLKHDTKYLVSTMGIQSGSWGNYDEPPKSRSTASPLNREFGMIALREAQRNGQRVPKKCWMALADATLATQQKNGGWSYNQSVSKGTPTANMTVAALNCLLGVNEVQGKNLTDKQQTLLHSAIVRAISWLNKHAKTDENVGGTTLMSYLYGLERVAMSCGLAEIRKRDWFQDGARAVIKTHCGVRKAKGSTINLAFALLFLSRGRVPIALCELAVDKGAFDQLRTAEVITSRVSQQTERDLAWQIVTKRERIDAWLSAPLLFIQDIDAIPEDMSLVSQYITKGGLVVMLGTKKVCNNFISIANKLCPNISSQLVDASHWTHTILNKINGVKITAWNDGIRDRILVVNGTSKSLVASEKSKLSQVLVNICCGVAELDRWKPRVAQPLATKSKKTLWIAEHDGSWDAELEGIHRWKTKTKTINKMKQHALVLVGGLYDYEATESLANEVIRIAKLGSTVLVESIGGQNTFASTMQLQIQKITGNTFTYDERFHHFNILRGWSILNRKHIEPPLITTINDGAIIIVDCDIRNALLDKSAWGVHGYGPVHAVQLIETLLDE